MLNLIRKRIILLLLLLIIDVILSCPFISSKVTLIEDKIIKKEVPIFEFRKIIEECIIHNDKDNNKYELEILYNKYIDCLRDYYLQIFTDDMKNKGQKIDEVDFTNMKLRVIKECKAAMTSAIPSNYENNWNYDGTLLELINDIDQIKNEYLDVNQIDNIENKKISKFSSRNLFKKRLKWVLSRCAIFAINYFQMILHRKSSVRAANKRLAEVPEFPLL